MCWWQVLISRISIRNTIIWPYFSMGVASLRSWITIIVLLQLRDCTENKLTSKSKRSVFVLVSVVIRRIFHPSILGLAGQICFRSTIIRVHKTRITVNNLCFARKIGLLVVKACKNFDCTIYWSRWLYWGFLGFLPLSYWFRYAHNSNNNWKYYSSGVRVLE